MKAKPMKLLPTDGYRECLPGEKATHVLLHLPGPLSNRMLPVILMGEAKYTNGPCWEWNGDIEKPTLSPSILTRGEDTNGKHVCHSFVRNGKVEFLNDCTHEFAGQTLDLLEVEE